MSTNGNGNGHVEPTETGAPWFAYRRPEVTVGPRRSTGDTGKGGNGGPEGNGGRTNGNNGWRAGSGGNGGNGRREGNGGRTNGGHGAVPPRRPPDARMSDPQPITVDAPSGPPYSSPPSGWAGAAVCAGALFLCFVCTRMLGIEASGVVLFPVAGFGAAMGFARRCERVHPDEPWLPRLLILGVLAKLIASYVRYLSFTDAYGGIGDANTYDVNGRKFVAAWLGQGKPPELENLQQTNFVKWVSGLTYYTFGQDLLAAFLLFGLLAVIGSYLWYRALSDGVPVVNRRLFLILLLFAPSVMFWPAALGKEALMQLALGALAWATSLILRGRLASAAPVAIAGGWLVWVVRPPLLALAVVAAAIPILVGRFAHEDENGNGNGNGNGEGVKYAYGRVVAIVLVSVALFLGLAGGANIPGLPSMSLDSVQSELDYTTSKTSKGGSEFNTAGATLNPVYLPANVVTVLFRPFLWEVRGGLQLLAALETTALLVLIVVRWNSVRFAFARCRRYPFLLYCWLQIIFFSMVLAAFGNFGLLTRQRSLALPAVFAILAVEPALARRKRAETHPYDAIDVNASTARIDRRAPVPRMARYEWAGTDAEAPVVESDSERTADDAGLGPGRARRQP